MAQIIAEHADVVVAVAWILVGSSYLFFSYADPDADAVAQTSICVKQNKFLVAACLERERFRSLFPYCSVIKYEAVHKDI